MDAARPRTVRDALWLGVACLSVGVLAWGWELLAHQVPSSPWHVRGVPGAIERLALHAWIEAALIFALAPRAWTQRFEHDVRAARRVLVAAGLGSALVFATLAWGAATGVLGFQIRDPYAAGRMLLLVRLGGEALLLSALIPVVSATLASPSPPPT